MFLFLKHTASSHLPPDHWENRIWVHSRHKESWVQTCPLPSRAVCQWVATSPVGGRLMRPLVQDWFEEVRELPGALFLRLRKRCLPLGQGSQRVAGELQPGEEVWVYLIFWQWRVMGVKGERAPRWQVTGAYGVRKELQKAVVLLVLSQASPSLDPSAGSQQHWAVTVPLTPQSPREHNWHSNTSPGMCPGLYHLCQTSSSHTSPCLEFPVAPIVLNHKPPACTQGVFGTAWRHVLLPHQVG